MDARSDGFWQRPRTWKALLLLAVYLAFYLSVSHLVARVFDDRIDPDNVVGDASSIFFGLALPIAIGGAALVTFAVEVGWLSEILSRQPVAASGWMWIAPALVLGVVVARLAGVDWGDWSGRELAALVLLGACIGITEELATRGLAVKILRDAGHGERFVAVVSSALFAAMHLVNLIVGMSLRTVGATVIYTFCFGMCMYLSMRVTGFFLTAVVLHGLTDPVGILASGGVDTEVSGNDASVGIAVAAVLTVVMLVYAVVAIFLVRGRARGAPLSG